MPIPPERDRPTETEIEVTEEMVRAGARVLEGVRSLNYETAEEAATEIFMAMVRAKSLADAR